MGTIKVDVNDYLGAKMSAIVGGIDYTTLPKPDREPGLADFLEFSELPKSRFSGLLGITRLTLDNYLSGKTTAPEELIRNAERLSMAIKAAMTGMITCESHGKLIKIDRIVNDI